MQGPHGEDPACNPRPAEPCLPELSKGAKGLRIAVAGGYFESHALPEALEAVALAARALGAGRRIDLPEAARARAAALVITAAEGANLHLANLQRRAADFDPLVRDRLLAGALLPAGWYLQAQRFRRWYAERVARLFAEVDVILAPSTPVSAPRVGETTLSIAGTTMMMRPSLGLLTQPVSFIGLPVAAVPIHRPARMPLGVQVIAAPWREDRCLRVAAALEAAGVAASPVAIP
jgi:Asp-tRNA(Asn)/Glu-tRNA(Gln) amidotransferase A subunit family amidase